LLLARHVQVVSVEQVERRPRYQTLYLVSRFSRTLIEIGFGFTLSVLGRDLGSHPITEIAGVAIDLYNRWVKVEQISFHSLKNRVITYTVFATRLACRIDAA
jgi:hypothetical protein